MKRKFNLKQNKNQKINMNSEEKKTEEMKNVEEETAEKNMEQPAAEEEQPVEGEAQQEAEKTESGKNMGQHLRDSCFHIHLYSDSDDGPVLIQRSEDQLLLERIHL